MSAMPTPIQEAPVVHMLPVERVLEITNTRKHFDAAKLEDLAKDVEKRGVLQPALVRPHEGDDYQLIFGARRLRASKMAGLTHLPCIVRMMTDEEVLETQLIENAKREDITPLEEAEAFERLRTEYGYSVEKIAENLTGSAVKKSIAYVYGRLKLCDLIPEAREALSAGKLTASTALLVARIPAPLQKQAIEELEPDEDGEPLGAREAFRRIQFKFMLTLDAAPFDTKSADLLPTAGACTTCVKRTGNQPELFADVSAKDTCTDPGCFAEKKGAHWVKLRTKAEAEGRPVLEGKEAKKIIQHGRVVAGSGFIDLAEKNFAGVDYAKAQTFGEQLGKRAPATTLVLDDRGVVHELVDAKEAAKVLEAKGIEVPHAVRPQKPQKQKAETEGERQKREATKAAAAIAIGRIVAASEKKEPERAFWRALVDIELDMGNPIDPIVVRRGFAKEGEPLTEKAEDALRASLEKLSVEQLRGFFVELTIADSAEFYRPDDDRSVFARLLSAFKVDMRKLVDEQLAKLKTAPKTTPSGKQKYVISTDGGKTMTVTKQESVPAKAWAGKKAKNNTAKTAKKKGAKK